MNFIMKIFGYPLGWLMYGMYQLVSNYGVALILFTLAVKILMFPLASSSRNRLSRCSLSSPRCRKFRPSTKTILRR